MRNPYANWDIAPADIYDPNDLVSCHDCEDNVWFDEATKGNDGEKRCPDCHMDHIAELKKEGVI